MRELSEAAKEIKKVAQHIYLPSSHLEKILTTCNRYLRFSALCNDKKAIKDIKYSCLLLKFQVLEMEKLITQAEGAMK